MAFRNFDRLLFAKAEATAGTAETITSASDFFEVIEPNFSITPLMFERFTKSQTLTTQTQTVPGAGKAAPVATCEVTFGVELAGPGTGVSSGTKPKIDRLLQACGLVGSNVFTYATTNTTYTKPFYHLENIEGTAGSYSSPDAKSWSCNSYGDSEFWAISAGTLGNVAVKSEHSGAAVTASGTGATQVGVGYSPVTTYTGDVANSTVTLQLYVGGGAYVKVRGCKGSFDLTFTHGDRAVVNFTFTGILDSYTESGSTPSDHSYTAELPPAFINTGLKFGLEQGTDAYFDGALFNSMALSMGNDVTVRENTNNASGFSHAVITNRNPTLTFNPDAVLSSGNYDFWNGFLAGTPARMRWSVGSTAGNRVDFRATSAQFSGITDGDRDSVSIIDSTTNLTGGTFGSTIITSGGDPSGSTFGSDNEFFMLFR